MLLPSVFNRVAAAAGIALSCDVRETCFGRSLVAPVGGVEPRQPLVQTPLSSCLVAESSAELAMAIDSERELGRESSFFTYLEDVVPSDFPTLPSYDSSAFPIDAIACEQTRTHIRSLEPMSWAEAVVSTRACTLPDGRLALVPGLDLLNHSPSATGTSCTVATNAHSQHFLPAAGEARVEIRTDDAVQEGQEVFIKYGHKTNRDLLCDYGFCLEDNEDDEQLVMVPICESSSLKTVRCRVYADGRVNDADVGSLRAAIATGGASLGSAATIAEFSPSASSVKAQDLQPLSEENERAARDALAAAIKAQAAEAVAAAAALEGKGEEEHQEASTRQRHEVVQQFNSARAKLLFRAHAKLLATPPGRRINSFVPSYTTLEGVESVKGFGTAEEGEVATEEAAVAAAMMGWGALNFPPVPEVEALPVAEVLGEEPSPEVELAVHQLEQQLKAADKESESLIDLDSAEAAAYLEWPVAR